MSVTIKRKSCATCTYWGGQRKINSFSSGVVCDSGTKGICGNPKAAHKKKEIEAEYGSCLKYEKWNALTALKV